MGLDVGLKRTTLGSKIFSAMKGAFDGGLEIPHNEKKFYGYDPDEGAYDAEANRERILGGHVAEYMSGMLEEEPEEYEVKFANYIKAGIDADNMEEKYLEVHQKIRENPAHVPTEKKKPSVTPTPRATLSSSTALASPSPSARTPSPRRRPSSSPPSRRMSPRRRTRSKLSAPYLILFGQVNSRFHKTIRK